MYNVITRRVCVTTVVVEKQYLLHILNCVSSKAHAPYYIAICGISSCTILYHIVS